MVVLQRLIKFTWPVPRVDVEDTLTDMLSEAQGLLEGRNKTHRAARSRVDLLFEKLELEWTVKSVVAAPPGAADASSGTTASAPLSWKNPTVGWLADWNHFQPQKLPKMKVPGGRGDGVYESPEEYFDSMLKLWVGMTFVDGNNALLPHCTAKGANDKVCDQPLWPIVTSSVDHSGCKSHSCSRHVEFVCANRNHDRGLCRRCASRRQEVLRGPPSSHASTHIYDATVTSVRFDGSIYVENVESRKPPVASVHWKTTKRLACPNLVGIVLLENRGNSLRLTDTIFWAKIALHGDSRDEFKEREAKKVALSLLNYSSDDSPNPLLDRSIPKGTAVAIIDCQTFVPEFVPVLTALEHQSAEPMAFQGGALLNLRRRSEGTSRDVIERLESRLGFSTEVDDIDAGEEYDIQLGRPPLTKLSSIAHRIQELVAESELDPIQQIRRDGRLQAVLERRLTELVTGATLDAGQLESFMEALRFPVHCTQGPPGTGKSYLGVVVVRALLIVRDLWMKVSESVGAPPILVLSYKNHAIDEFLLDLVRKEPFMRHVASKNNFGGYRPLVRIGGGCSEPELFHYQEFNSSRKSPLLVQLTDKIGRLHTLNDQVHRFRDRFGVIKECQFVILDPSTNHDENRRKRDRKVCQDAAAELTQIGGAIIACTNALSDLHGSADPDEDADKGLKDALQIVEGAVTGGAVALRHRDIPQLLDGIRHYDPSMDPAEILHYWMSGLVPLPVCSVDYCEGISDGTSALCNSHRCIYGANAAKQCDGVIVDNRKYCARHLCITDHCKRPRETERQLYCSSHICFVCAADEQVEVAQAAVEEPPRNVCEAHPLCWAVDGDDYCVNLARQGDSFCESHASTRCQGLQKNGKPCPEQAISRSSHLCRAHMAEQEAIAAAQNLKVIGRHGASSKCHALNAKGKPCGTRPLSGEKYCGAHRWKANEEVAEEKSAEDQAIVEVANEVPVSDEMNELHYAPGADSSTPEEVTQSTDAVDEAASEHVDASDGLPVVNDDDDSSFSDVCSTSSESEAEFDADKFDFDNYDEVEESEHLQHLRDIDEVEEAAKAASDSDDVSDNDAVEDAPVFDLHVSGESGVASTTEWTWEMPLPMRWASIAALLGQWSPISQQVSHLLKQSISSAKRELYYEELKVKARAFEGKAVIGGTITGCVARLDAIRATNPFAILVEEASEVLEPLLFSCLCSSTCKLEMIGDHLQLQPSVMSKFDFERVNRINISMFERLIRSPPSHAVPSSVLSIQRRMRKDICDLTREFYADITDIEDHEVCLTKTIQQPPLKVAHGWKMSAKSAPNLLEHCEGNGREIPGVLPHVFFWEHSGAEARAKVGLSRINQNEAEMACGLAKYLETCGVPPSSIAILTPYKGQLMLMRDLLMRKYNMVKFVKQGYGGAAGQQRPVPSCALSTVDRFQGDEADVVIISLVIDGKSKTPFVKLQNRMIVLLSRARIGMYVIGNTKYFGETPHWKATFDLLRQSTPSDNSAEVDRTCRVYSQPRIGMQLPLCCPQHRESTIMAHRVADLGLSFCKVLCDEELPCSHECGLQCHYPNITTHNAACKVEIESPCLRHPRTMPCSHFCTTTGLSHISLALKNYRCDVRVDVQLPCTHEQSLKCADTADISDGIMSYPKCTEAAIAPYVYPKCKHMKTCSCVEYHRYMAGAAPPCEKIEEYCASCGHSVTMQCHRRTEIMANPSKFVCKQSVTARLPRCGHRVTVACPIAQTFDSWAGAVLTTPGVVDEGGNYGPKDHSCTETVTFRRRCGHEVKMKCEQAFDIARSPPPCTKHVSFVNPECGHTHQTTCSDAKKFAAMAELALDDDDDNEMVVSPVMRVDELDRAAAFRDLGLGIRCNESVTLVRQCQHTEEMSCNMARHQTTACKQQIQLTNPCCGHQVTIPCEFASTLKQWNPWSLTSRSDEAQKNAIKVLHENGVLQDSLECPLQVPPALTTLVKDCEHSLLFRRSKSCGHGVRMKCSQAMKQLNTAGGAGVPPCNEMVQKQYSSCSHEVRVLCSRDISKVRCHAPVDRQCWNFEQCNNTVKSVCSAPSSIVQCSSKIPWTCARGHVAQIQVCSQGVPQQCPTCSYESLVAEIRDTSAMLDPTSTIIWPPREAADAVPQLTGANCKSIKLDRTHHVIFLQRKLEVLNKFKRSIEKVKGVWTRTVFQPKLIPIFAVYSKRVGEGAPAPDFRSFEMRDFGDTNSQGIQVREATRKNVETLLAQHKGADVRVVFGVAYSLGVCLDSNGYPRNGKGLAGLRRRWIDIQRDKFGFDSLSSPQQNSPLTLWDPYAAFPTHEVMLSTGCSSEGLVDRLPIETTWRTQSRFVAFTPPRTLTGNSGSILTPGREVVPNSDYLDKLQPLLVAEFPWADGIQLFQLWDGQGFSVSGTTLPSAVENGMRAKLSFVPAVWTPSGVKPKHSSRPFSGLKLLQKLVKQQPFVESDLLCALEFLVLNKDSTKEAEENLAAYVSVITKTNGLCHPLVLLAFARLAGRNKSTRAQSLEFLKIFREMFPQAVELWLSSDERELLDSKISGDSELQGNAKKSPDDLSVDERWRLLKQQKGCQSEAMEELLKMVGLRRVKDSALKLFKSAVALQKMEPAKRKKNAPALNYCFMGNPGTGKTTVARLFARILNDSRMRTNPKIEMCGAQKLKDDGAAKFRDKIESAMGGVIFIDEAYELDPMGDSNGKPIVAELLTAAEDKRDELSIILAGYEEDIQQKLYKYNDGIKSRFEEIFFDDFDEADLRVVWDGILADREWVADDKCGVIACRRLARGAGVKGFGNARAVRRLFEQSSQAAMAREDFNGITEIRTVDVLGERPTKNPKLASVLSELDDKIGWKRIKTKVKELVEICDKNYARELTGVDTIPVSMNRLFLGSPGTGKTTFAGIYGRVLKCLNFLSIGEVIVKTASDFVGQYVGQSQTKTSDILKLAKGKVLVIDEAYNLDDNMYGKQVLDVLVEKVQGTERDDIAVVLIGYESQMLEMLRTQNPGLARRFPQQNAFYFDDYSETELLDIFMAACARKKVHCPLSVAELAIRQLALQKSQANFGNAGAVELILKSAIANASNRPLDGDLISLLAEDVESEVMKRARLEAEMQSAGSSKPRQDNPLAALDSLYRMDKIKMMLEKIQTSIQVAQDEGSEIPKIGHFVFRGSPGTGKTTVARAIAKIFHRMGILATDKLVETSGLNMTGEYVGQTKKCVEKQLGEARGGVLFIDEAYELGKGHFGEEAMTSLVAAMTNPVYAGIVIIIAGYPRDLDEMLDRNAGLKSRFNRFVDFQDWETNDCFEFTLETSKREGYALSFDALASVRRTFDTLRRLPMFGNGRDVMQMWSEMLDCRAQRVKRNPEMLKTITAEDAEAAGQILLAGRTPATGKVMRQSSPSSGPVVTDESQRNAPSTSTDTREMKKPSSDQDSGGDDDEEDDDDEENQGKETMADRWGRIDRDPGVSEATWVELERAKRANDEMMHALKDAADRAVQEEAKRKLAEFVAAQEKLRRLSKCPMGYVWLQVGGGWRCAGGSHFVSDAELQRNFMH